jgi:hypothetical protein
MLRVAQDDATENDVHIVAHISLQRYTCMAVQVIKNYESAAMP